ncbi:adenylate/guanylate cyclase domain-containing protein [Bacteroidota bacterium]
MPEDRRLAAIMFTDIVGYTSLMGSDEDKAFQLLRKNRDLQRPLIKKYRGEWLKEMGDGILAQFNSATDAVECAIEIQQQAKQKFEGQIRIGIHLGDVTFENEDVFGDGVNIASRLQSVADPGGIYISESIYEAIRARKDIHCKVLGDIQLKNVDHPVKTYYIRGKGLSVPSIRKKNELTDLHPKPLLKRIWFYVIVLLAVILITLTAVWILSTKNQPIRSIVVLPPENLSDNTVEEWLEAGIHYGLIDGLSKIHALRIPSRNTSLKYDHTDMTIPEIARDIKVKGVVTVTYYTIEDSVSIHVRLIRPFPKERQIWEQAFDRPMKYILSIYDDVAVAVAEVANIPLSPDEQSLLTGSREVDPEAYEAYLKGMISCDKGTKSDLDNALDFFQQALKIDSTYARAYLGIAAAWSYYSQHGFLPRNITQPKYEEALRKAQELDNTQVDRGVGIVREMYQAILRGDWEDTFSRFRKITDSNPKNGFFLVFYGHFLSVLGQPTEGLTYSYRAVEVDTLNELVKRIHALNLKNARKYDELQQIARELPNNDPVIGLPALWAVYHEKGEYTEAFNVAKKIYTLKGNDAAIEAMEAGYEEGGYQLAMQRIAEKMIAYRDTAYFAPWQISTLYTRAGLKKEALDWLWKAFEEQDHNIVVIGADPLFDILRDEPRFKELLRKMNLPVD